MRSTPYISYFTVDFAKIASMSSVQELTTQMVKKIEEVSHLLRKKREFIKWTKFLNKNIRMIRRLLKNKVLDKHKTECQRMNKTRITLPTEDEKIIEFKNFKFQEKQPFVIYADLECLLQKHNEHRTNNTSYYQKHIPCSIAYFLKCSYDNSLDRFELYTGEDCISWFMKQLFDISKRINNILVDKTPMEALTQEQKSNFINATHCHICKKAFKPGDKKVLDHSHLTGAFRGVAHNFCNLTYQDSKIIPVVFHNLSYDSHFLIKTLSLEIPGNITLLPLTKEKYISFTKHVKDTKVKLRFIDSFRFLPSSLDKLSSYLSESEKSITRSHCNSDAEFQLLQKKGIFCYDFLDCWEKLTDVTVLPPIENFQNQLTNSTLSLIDYQHAKNVWETFNVQNLKEYMEIYLKCDVLLLADVFENFRRTCEQTYGLDCAHYYTLPGYTWDSVLKHSGVKLELLTDMSMFLFIDSSIRGGGLVRFPAVGMPQATTLTLKHIMTKNQLVILCILI